MKKIVLLALALLGATASAHAQQATTVSSCGGITYDTAGIPQPDTQNLTGEQCVRASVNGGPTAANQTATQAPVAPATATSTKATATAGRYHSTPDTVTDGQEDETQLGPHGENKVCQVDSTGACADTTAATPVVPSQQKPNGSTQIIGPGTGTTGAVVGTLAGTVNKTTYICGFDVSAVGGTAAVGPITVAGLLGGSFVYQLNSAAAAVNFSKTYFPCLPASGTNTAITVTTTADGTATAVDVNPNGFNQ